MSIKTKIAALALAALAVTGTIASTTTRPQAKPLGWGWGVGAGLVGAAIVGTAIAASNDGYYYDGYRRCGWVRQFDAYGNYIGRVRTCDYLRLELDLTFLGLTRFLHANRKSTSLENASDVDPASGTGASSTPCRTRPARLSPRAGQLFGHGEPHYTPCKCPATLQHVTERCHLVCILLMPFLLLRITCNKSSGMNGGYPDLA